MFSRIVVVAALAVGTLAVAAPGYAQTGVSGSDAVNGGAASPNGSVGTPSNTPRSGSMNAPRGMGRQAMRGDAGERRMTECLNNAASQHQPMDSCRR
jgi:hypothetical protein